jgi:putative NIF3 family GTP cyclohydrolase 1 type 2
MRAARLVILSTVGLCAGTGVAAAQSAPTAREIVEQIQRHTGAQWNPRGVDTFKEGDPDTPVTGVVVTMMATFDVLRRAAASGANFVITHEPIYYSHRDTTGALEREADPVFAAKRDFIREHHLVVWRFHDNWHARQPDGIQAGMERKLGWGGYRTAANDSMSNDRPATDFLFRIPATTAGELAGELAGKLDAHAVRLVGDPKLPVRGVAFAGGFLAAETQRALLRRPDVDALVIGEAHEWETIAYAADAVSEGERKALIVVGHTPSEQGGMEECARWLRGFVTSIPVRFIASSDPWSVGGWESTGPGS